MDCKPRGVSRWIKDAGTSLGRFGALTALLVPAALLAQPPVQAPAQDDPLIPFSCPETYASDAARQAGLKQFLDAYSAKFPDNTVGDLMGYRYRELVSHACAQTLKSMLADVAPVSSMLSLQDRNFGPRTEEYDQATGVWSIYFRRDGASARRSQADLIFNFYGRNPAVSAEKIAQAFMSRRDNVEILGSFQAPDGVTRAPAFYVVSQTLYPEAAYSYVNITKITSVGGAAYAVTFARRFPGVSSDDAAQRGKTWFLSPEGQAMQRTIGDIGADASWQEYLAKADKK